MAVLEFRDLNFRIDGDDLCVRLYRHFSCKIPLVEIGRIGRFSVSKNSIEFEGITLKKARRRFILLLEKAFSGLKSEITGKPATYIHRNSGIPLIGNVAFGIIDRGTNLLEIKPVTGCNLSCIYCSVNQDARARDFVIEEEYLYDEIIRVMDEKGCNFFDLHFASQGEPLYYEPLERLIGRLSARKDIGMISVDTNGTLLTKEIAASLLKAGLKRFNLSINSLDMQRSKHIAGAGWYDPERIKEIARHIIRSGGELIITPVMIPGINEDDITDMIRLASDIGAEIGIQNYLSYRGGRNPAKEMPFDKFYTKLKKLEKSTGRKLIMSAEDFSIVPCRSIKKPFRKGEIIDAEVVCPGRLKGEMIAAAKGRSISVMRPDISGKVRIRINKTKHNIFSGEVA